MQQSKRLGRLLVISFRRYEKLTLFRGLLHTQTIIAIRTYPPIKDPINRYYNGILQGAVFFSNSETTNRTMESPPPSTFASLKEDEQAVRTFVRAQGYAVSRARSTSNKVGAHIQKVWLKCVHGETYRGTGNSQ